MQETGFGTGRFMVKYDERKAYGQGPENRARGMWAGGSFTSKATGRTGQTLKEIMNFSSNQDTCYITNLRVLENA